MNTTIKIEKETMDNLRRFGAMGDSWNTVLQKVLNIAKDNTTESDNIQHNQSQTSIQHFEEVEMFKTAKVDKYGKASISRTLAGKTIEYRVKQ